jgi:uncharacterized membrane protein SpoIIM required for sporulation
MNADEFRRERQSEWQALADLLKRSQDGLSRLSPQEIDQLGRLYRAVTSDLALAQRDFPGERVTQYLNQLVGQAHSVVYRSEPFAVRRLVHFVVAGFPRVVRGAFWYIAAAALFFLSAAAVSAVATYWQPETARWFLPAQAQALIPIIEREELWVDIPLRERPYVSAFIMSNNIQVAFMAFGSGILAGVVTLWIMVFNGLLLGSVTGLTAHYGVAFELWTFVIGHGVVELSVIFIAGGAGLMLGWSVIQPGLLRRRDALALAGRRAVRLIVGCVPLLVLAGLIEGFISPNENLPAAVKWAVGLGSGLLLYSYLYFAGREQEPESNHALR